MTGPSASDAWRRAAGPRDRDDRASHTREEPTWAPEEWIDEGALRDEASGAINRGRRNEDQQNRRTRPGDKAAAGAERQQPRRRQADGGGESPRPGSLGHDARAALGASLAQRVEARLKDASRAFRRERYEEARRILRPLAEQAPQIAPVRELYGLTLYRLGRWRAAAAELEAFRNLSGTTEQNPVLADCYRALRRYERVEELWDELRSESPSAELVAEGRIVAAGALADQGRLQDAIRVLARGSAKPRARLREHHLRQSYALADLYERAGDLPRARETFRRIASADPSFVDVDERLRALV